MAKDSAKQNKELGAMTAGDEDENREIVIDAKAIETVFVKLGAEQRKMEEVKKAKAKELAKVKVDKDEVKLVAEQLGVTSHEATAMLKECGGSAKVFFDEFINREPAKPIEV